ncbi:MAG: bifunctional adenosylcobinamide kinase/adenosylcobinamide-phosphate guanylyltransferase [Planctomycetes bacterium]|nr:bifunctional adenosylcobinamide kinase/adenosylcobinamide-phosphate guanylyltransferase [Planctomycetota bacterium]
MGKMVFVTGGARSGKSAFAEGLMKGRDAVAYIATARADDDEMRARVQKHRERRPKSWVTLERPKGADEAVRDAAKKCSGILIDCITIYVTNLLLDDVNTSDKEGYISREIKALCKACRDVEADVVLISNEVGSGIVPDNALARQFRDAQGLANQALAQEADEVYFLVAGLPIKLK